MAAAGEENQRGTKETNNQKEKGTHGRAEQSKWRKLQRQETEVVTGRESRWQSNQEDGNTQPEPAKDKDRKNRGTKKNDLGKKHKTRKYSVY